jgi:formate dehydrogenase subunit delta
LSLQSTEEDLQRMANQIAANYAYHDASVAAGEVANHLRLFWTPAMRELLVTMVASGEFEFSSVVRAAVEQLVAA